MRKSRMIVISSLFATCLIVAEPLAAGEPELQSVGILGEQSNQNFGRRAAQLGDVNGNGFDDVAIAAPFANNGTGIVYVFFGGPEFFNTTPDLVLHGQAANDQFGWDIAGNMDLNGNGYKDIAIAARFSNLGGTNAGAVFIHFGGPTLSTTPDLILTGENADDWFGNSVSAASDVNGDGYDDLIVGAPYNDDTGNASGKAYIFFGGPGSGGMNNQPDVILYGASVNHAHFGWSVGGGGDVNGDGFADVVVGARLHGQGPSQARGRVYVFHGGAPMNPTADLIIDGEFAHDWFGESVSHAGDVNGDGYDDIIVGAHFANANGSSSGKAYVFYGGPSGVSATPAFTLAGPHADSQLGYRVSNAGDVNGDGYDDVIVGAHFANVPGAFAAGKAYVVFGGPNVRSNQPDIELAGTQANEQFGECVSGAGLVTGEAPAAFIVGAHYNNEAGSAAGKAFIYRFGDRAQPVFGDLNGDGVVNVFDLLILLGQWGPCENCDDCPADLDNDCTVNVFDLLLLLGSWG